jgi:hypothetical protein
MSKRNRRRTATSAALEPAARLDGPYQLPSEPRSTGSRTCRRGLAGLPLGGGRGVLRRGRTAADAPKDVKDAALTFGRAFRTFFEKKSILAMAAFAFFY